MSEPKGSEDGDGDGEGEGDRRVATCPECDQATVRIRGPRGQDRRTRAPDADYYCTDCGHYFDTPHHRAPKGGTSGVVTQPGVCGLGAQLGNADPDDDWSEIVHGGGED